ncbi:hypothetical protein ABT095_32205 [Kitasatospora sp. NPDC002227]|uniref:hypothetical protein n=1 Tax=Kitasatospora sp. NPDC002227 TaxID=3154773 RepID=UPI003329297F
MNRAVLHALNYRKLYQPVLVSLGLPGATAWVLSVFALRDGWTPDRLAEGTNQQRYQTVIAQRILDVGYTIWPTDVTGADGDPYRTNPVHYDICVADHTLEVPTALSNRDGSTENARKAARASLAAHFEPVLALWSNPLEL